MIRRPPRSTLFPYPTLSRSHRNPGGADMNFWYTAEGGGGGGGGGHGRTSDGRLTVELSVPKEMGGEGGPGTNPEQLFAVGYAACFQSTLLSLARGRKLDASDSTITARVGIGPTGHGGFGLTVALDLHAPHLSRGEAEDLMRRAHEHCPCSNGTGREHTSELQSPCNI